MSADFLKHLLPADQELVNSLAETARFEEDQIILREGEERNALFFIRSGSVRVERAHLDFRYEISRLEAGEIFGEMGFVEGFVASANVIANSDVEASVISLAHINKIGENDPGFRGRFYHSLAEILSQRLRETTLKGAAEFSWGGNSAKARRPERYVPSDEDAWGGPSWDIGDDDFEVDEYDL